MIIYNYKPNGFGSDDYYSYSGDVKSIRKLSGPPGAPTNGWLINCWGFFFKRLNFVFFGENGQIFLDCPHGVFNCSSNDVSIRYRKIFNILFVNISMLNKFKVKYIIYIPMSRFIFNDGMFPEDVEPLYDVLKRINDPFEHRRLANLLSSGIKR